MNNSDYQFPSNNFFAAENNDLDSTGDDFEEERKELEHQQAEQNRTNLFKTRVIESEINSSLVFQIALYYNWFYCFLCFVLQLSSIAYKLYIFTNDNFTIARIVLVLVWFIVENIRLNMGYRANIQEIFYDYLLFILVTFIFVTPFQVILIVPSGRVLPMDYATTIILLVFEGLELIFCILAMIKVSKRQNFLC